jgi:hypothetical protein
VVGRKSSLLEGSTTILSSIISTSIPTSTLLSLSKYPYHTSATMYGSFLLFLLDPTFWSRLGFLISYIATSLIAVEVFRLICTDANKRDVEKFLESYSKQRARTVSPPRRKNVQLEREISVNIDELESVVMEAPKMDRPVERSVRAAVSPDSDKIERRKRATSSASRAHAERTASPTPVRKLRKRSDTLTSTGSSESKRVSRRHREASPASEVAESRHGSPRPRSREDREKRSSGLGLGKLIRGKV